LDYFNEILWDESLAQDRFFGYADKSIVDQVRRAAMEHEFAPEPNPGLFHPDATSSFKQIQFGEANVQLTFHEKDTKKIGSGQPLLPSSNCRSGNQRDRALLRGIAEKDSAHGLFRECRKCGSHHLLHFPEI
jgi:hypothetical protein